MSEVGAGFPADACPAVDVVMPVRNEAAHLVDAVDAVTAQNYRGKVHIYLAVGPSEDATQALADELEAHRTNVTVVPNPRGTTPVALNLAIAAGEAPIVVRVDGHSRLSESYIETAVDLLLDTGAANVGGVQRAEGRSPFEMSVAAAMTSRVGVGNSIFHFGTKAQEAETVYLGVFQRAAIEQVGLFDETLIRNQDYELNWRLREAGGLIYFDPRLSVEYRPRSTLAKLASQYFEYGRWKREVLRRHPASVRARQLAPPLLVAGLAASLAGSVVSRKLITVPAGYSAALVLAAAYESRAQRLGVVPSVLLPTVFATMHIAWGCGFLVGCFDADRRDAARPDG